MKNTDLARKLEKTQQQANDRLSEIETMLADMSLYDAENKAKLTQVLAERTTLAQSLEESEMEWLDVQESIEEIELQVRSQL